MFLLINKNICLKLRNIYFAFYSLKMTLRVIKFALQFVACEATIRTLKSSLPCLNNALSSRSVLVVSSAFYPENVPLAFARYI